MLPGEPFKNVYKAIPLPMFVSDQKKSQNGTYAKQILGDTDLKLSMLTRITLRVTWVRSHIATICIWNIINHIYINKL